MEENINKIELFSPPNGGTPELWKIFFSVVIAEQLNTFPLTYEESRNSEYKFTSIDV